MLFAELLVVAVAAVDVVDAAVAVVAVVAAAADNAAAALVVVSFGAAREVAFFAFVLFVFVVTRYVTKRRERMNGEGCGDKGQTPTISSTTNWRET